MIEQLKQCLNKGETVLLPTETVYGLFARALDKEAVLRVYQLKQRPLEKPMSLNVASFQDMLKYSRHHPPYLKKLVTSFLPGPLTVVLLANAFVPVWVNGGRETVAFRIPRHKVTLSLIQACGPLVGSSANVSGRPSGCQFERILASFQGKIQGFPDDQALMGQDSTILDLSSPKARILRKGSISPSELLAAIPELSF